MIVRIAVIGAAVLFGLGIVGMALAAIRSLAQGKTDAKRIGLMAIPVLAFAVAFLVLGDLVEAAILATGIMMGLLLIAIALSGVRGVLK